MKPVPVIAVVDDDASIRTAAGRLLRSAGYAVRLFDSAEAFLEDESASAPAALLSDIHMPGMSGIDLHAALRARDCALPVLLMTGFPDAGEHAAAMALGARCVLTKPFDADELLGHLDAATGGV